MTARPFDQSSPPRLVAEPLTAAGFAPFGDVLAPPAQPGRAYFNEALCNGRATAQPSLWLSHIEPKPVGPLAAVVMERHEHSSQSFIALEAGRWLVVVAPHGPEGGPDMANARAFVCGPHQGITYRADVWHHPLTVLDAPATFAVFMWRDGSSGDEEFVDIAPVPVETEGILP